MYNLFIYLFLFFIFYLGAQNVMRESVKKGGGASESALKISEADVSRNVFTMLGPIFKRHVLLAKQEAKKRKEISTLQILDSQAASLPAIPIGRENEAPKIVVDSYFMVYMMFYLT